MTAWPAFRRFALAYGTAFAVLYVVALKLDLALSTKFLRNNCQLFVNGSVIPAKAGIQRPPLDSGFRCADPE